MSRVLIIGGISHSLINFRGQLIKDMINRGHEVLACSGEVREDAIATLKKWGGPLYPGQNSSNRDETMGGYNLFCAIDEDYAFV